jgi:hypothetical protein
METNGEAEGMRCDEVGEWKQVETIGSRAIVMVIGA